MIGVATSHVKKYYNVRILTMWKRKKVPRKIERKQPVDLLLPEYFHFFLSMYPKNI